MATFHPFPRLPAELRLAIWEFTVEPRRLDLAFATPEKDNLFSSNPTDAIRPPAAAHACHEAREHLAKIYSKVSFSNSSAVSQPRFWFNASIDAIIIDQCDFNDIVDTPDVHLIQELSVAIWDTRKFILESLDCLRRLDKTLRTVTLVYLEHRGRGKKPDVNFQDDLRQVLAGLYWRCNPAPFSTTCYNPDLETEYTLHNLNYVHHRREERIKQIRNDGNYFGDIEDCEEYLNCADWFWFHSGWVHDGCNCEDGTLHQAQLLIDAEVEENPVDVPSFAVDWRH